MNKLAPFNEKWKLMFQREEKKLIDILNGQNIEQIEHIGATSVDSCDTFGTIDILVSAHSYLDLISIKNILIKHEYQYIKHLSEDLRCLMFIKRNNKKQIIATVRVVEFASIAYQEFILFKYYLMEGRNALRYNAVRENYLSDGDIKKYQRSKTEHIRYILKKYCRTTKKSS